jgi:hypothetical protein
MKTFEIYSAQTGSVFGNVQASDKTDALNKFAQSFGHKDARAMWDAGRFEYASAEQIAERHKMKYVVYFDDGRMLGNDGRYVREFPDAKQFTSKRAAEEAAKKKNADYTIEEV